jgi:hypothetical protein
MVNNNLQSSAGTCSQERKVKLWTVVMSSYHQSVSSIQSTLFIYYNVNGMNDKARYIVS